MRKWQVHIELPGKDAYIDQTVEAEWLTIRDGIYIFENLGIPDNHIHVTPYSGAIMFTPQQTNIVAVFSHVTYIKQLEETK